MKKRCYIALAFVCVLSIFFGCVQDPADDFDMEVNVNNEISVADSASSGIKTQWYVKMGTSRSHLSKGLLWENDVETDYAYYTKDPSKKFLMMRVDRITEPGKYFYVMLSNMDVKIDSACWAYDYNEANVAKYGRLYHCQAGKALCKEIKMNLPVYNADGTPYLNRRGDPVYSNVRGRMLSFQDVADIMERMEVGCMGKDVYSLMDSCIMCNDALYLDAFIAGIESGDNDMSCVEHTLAGEYIRYQNTGSSAILHEFRSKNQKGMIWVGDDWTRNATGHTPMRITRQGYDCKIDFACCFSDLYGFSVRAVIEPIYRTR